MKYLDCTDTLREAVAHVKSCKSNVKPDLNLSRLCSRSGLTMVCFRPDLSTRVCSRPGPDY